MEYKNNRVNGVFSHENFVNAIRLWERAAISLVDIRHNLISPESAIRGYRMPTSTFVYTSGGKAEVSLDDTSYRIERFGLFHGGKGTELSITPTDGWLEYYMVLYKAGEPPFHKKEFIKQIERSNPFRDQYGFQPNNPIFFAEQLCKMYERWKDPASLHLLYGKTAFYQLVYEIYEELEDGSVHILQPDIAAQAIRFIDNNYGHSITIQSIIEAMKISPTHLNRLIKQRTGKSPQDYLMHVRFKAVCRQLTNGDYTLKEIANATGFNDEYHMSRQFKKIYGMSPSEFRLISSSNMVDHSIGNLISFPYNEQYRVSVDKLKGKGEIYMLKQMRSKAFVAAVSLMLLLSACATTPSGTGTNESLSETSQVTETEVAEPVQEGTRTVSTSLGDVEVPMNPQRIAVQYIMGDVVSLGITPVGVSDVYDGAAFSGLVSDSVSLGWWPEWEEESVMALDPDLIIVIDEDYVEKFSKIAATVYVPQGEMSLEKRVTFIGEVLNRQEEAAEAINEYHVSVDEAKTKLSQAGFDNYTVSIFESGPDGMTVIGDKYNAGVTVYESLGLTPPDAVQANIIDKDTYSEMVSFEVLSEYSGDYIIRNTYEDMEDLSQDDIWNAIPAVKNNRVIGMEFGLSYYSDIYSATAQINYVTEALLEAAAQ